MKEPSGWTFDPKRNVKSSASLAGIEIDRSKVGIKNLCLCRQSSKSELQIKKKQIFALLSDGMIQTQICFCHSNHIE